MSAMAVACKRQGRHSEALYRETECASIHSLLGVEVRFRIILIIIKSYLSTKAPIIRIVERKGAIGLVRVKTTRGRKKKSGRIGPRTFPIGKIFSRCSTPKDRTESKRRLRPIGRRAMIDSHPRCPRGPEGSHPNKVSMKIVSQFTLPFIPSFHQAHGPFLNSDISEWFSPFLPPFGLALLRVHS